eukprot:1181382-Prorocentrum_minimum.AAC.1
MTSFYGSPCANNGKSALNTPETLCCGDGPPRWEFHLKLTLNDPEAGTGGHPRGLKTGGAERTDGVPRHNGTGYPGHTGGGRGGRRGVGRDPRPDGSAAA